MAKHLYVKLQSPTVELEVIAKDSTGNQEKVLVGFKRYNIEESQKRLDSFKDLVEKETSSSFGLLDNFLKEEIVYLKNISFDVEEEEKTVSITIKDTREESLREGLWETREICLETLLNLFLSSSPWRLPFITTLQKALYNVDFDSLNLKN